MSVNAAYGCGQPRSLRSCVEMALIVPATCGIDAFERILRWLRRHPNASMAWLVPGPFDFDQYRRRHCSANAASDFCQNQDNQDGNLTGTTAVDDGERRQNWAVKRRRCQRRLYAGMVVLALAC